MFRVLPRLRVGLVLIFGGSTRNWRIYLAEIVAATCGNTQMAKVGDFCGTWLSRKGLFFRRLIKINSTQKVSTFAAKNAFL